jgi:hypothetical protein
MMDDFDDGNDDRFGDVLADDELAVAPLLGASMGASASRASTSSS